MKGSFDCCDGDFCLTTPDDILEVLADCAEVKQVLPTFLKDFWTIKPGKYRVMLKPRGEGPPEEVLPSYITLHGRRASQFHAGRIPRCLYCNSATPCKRSSSQRTKKCFHCDEFSHICTECPNIIQPDNDENSPSSEASADHNSKNNITAIAEDSTLVENSAELFTPLPASANTTTEGHDSSQDSDTSGSPSSTHDESPECSRSCSPLNQAEMRKKTG